MSERQRCLDYIKQHTIARSDQLDEALELPLGRAASLLNLEVKSGLLVMCKVTRPGNHRTLNEYRYSVAGGGRTTEFRDLCVRKGAPVAVRVPPAREAPAAAGSRVLDEKRLQDASARQDKPASERAAPAQVGGEPPKLGPIEMGIPIPPTKRPIKGELRAHIQALQVGASFETYYSQKACRDHANALGIEITYRPLSMEKGSKRIRVWRTA